MSSTVVTYTNIYLGSHSGYLFKMAHHFDTCKFNREFFKLKTINNNSYSLLQEKVMRQVE